MEQAKIQIDALNKQIKIDNLKRETLLGSLIGVFGDESALFCGFTQKCYNCNPEVKYEEMSQNKESDMNFIAEIYINDQLVAKGSGKNKKASKIDGYIHALKNLDPKLLD